MRGVGVGNEVVSKRNGQCKVKGIFLTELDNKRAYFFSYVCEAERADSGPNWKWNWFGRRHQIGPANGNLVLFSWQTAKTAPSLIRQASAFILEVIFHFICGRRRRNAPNFFKRKKTRPRRVTGGGAGVGGPLFFLPIVFFLIWFFFWFFWLFSFWWIS